MAFRPICTILAGPNGSGKTTLFERLAPAGEQVNADRVARILNPYDPESVSGFAGRMVLKRLSELIAARQNFSYETTLSGRQPLALMATAKSAGYRIELAYVALRTPALSILRVRQRVLEGGHNIPVTDILRRYDRSLNNLTEAIALADEVAVFDNSDTQVRLLFQMRRGDVVIDALNERLPLHRRVGQAIDAAKRPTGAS